MNRIKNSCLLHTEINEPMVEMISAVIQMFSYTSNAMWELFALFSTTFYISCFQLENTLAVLQSSVPVLKLDLRLGSVVVRGYSRNNGNAPVIAGQNSPFTHPHKDFIKKQVTGVMINTALAGLIRIRSVMTPSAGQTVYSLQFSTLDLSLEIHLLGKAKEF